MKMGLPSFGHKCDKWGNLTVEKKQTLVDKVVHTLKKGFKKN